MRAQRVCPICLTQRTRFWTCRNCYQRLTEALGPIENWKAADWYVALVQNERHLRHIETQEVRLLAEFNAVGEAALWRRQSKFEVAVGMLQTGKDAAAVKVALAGENATRDMRKKASQTVKRALAHLAG